MAKRKYYRSKKQKRRRKRPVFHQGWYKGYWCDSGWELAYIIYALDHGWKIERNVKGFAYVYNKAKRTYYPDFIVNGKWVEIKGRKTRLWKAKLFYFPHPIQVLYQEELKPIFEYVEHHYGKDYPRLLNKHKAKPKHPSLAK